MAPEELNPKGQRTMKATELIKLLTEQLTKASLAGYSDVEVQLTNAKPRCGHAFDVDRVIFAEEIVTEEDEDENSPTYGEEVEHATGLKAIFITEGGEPEYNRYNFLPRQ